MTQEIDVRAVVPAPPAAVWADLVDGRTWPTWSPLGSYELVTPGSNGPDAPLGEVRIFRTKQVVGETVPREEVVEVVPEQRLSYVLLDGMPLDGYRADIDLTPVAGGTEVRWRSRFSARRRWMGPVYRRVLGLFIQRCVDGLAAKHAATRATP
ncbi:MAG TPA: SRPBCC family protein [Iamia sp.]